MTTVHVTEVPRCLEPVTPDPFIGDEGVRAKKNPAWFAQVIGSAVIPEPDRAAAGRGLADR